MTNIILWCLVPVISLIGARITFGKIIWDLRAATKDLNVSGKKQDT